MPESKRQLTVDEYRQIREDLLAALRQHLVKATVLGAHTTTEPVVLRLDPGAAWKLTKALERAPITAT